MFQAGNDIRADWQHALARRFGDELGILLRQLGAEVRHAQELTRLVSSRQRKAAFRLLLTDGRQVKARKFKTPEEAALALSLSPLLDDRHFSRTLAAFGSSSIEEWVSGVAPAANEISPEQARRAGALLGELHGTKALPDSATAALSIAEHVALMDTHLAALTRQQVLSAVQADRVREQALMNCPASFEPGLIHGDFCVDNMIVDGAGRLVLIDNESLCPGALDFDLARSWCRWPMTDACRLAFAEGYRQYRELDTFFNHRMFWAVRALLMSVYVHVKHGRPCPSALAALLRLGAGAEDGFWAALPCVERESPGRA